MGKLNEDKEKKITKREVDFIDKKDRWAMANRSFLSTTLHKLSRLLKCRYMVVFNTSTEITP
jgi:hypothetical protein